jgi:hypothetical protein
MSSSAPSATKLVGGDIEWSGGGRSERSSADQREVLRSWSKQPMQPSGAPAPGKRTAAERCPSFLAHRRLPLPAPHTLPLALRYYDR